MLRLLIQALAAAGGAEASYRGFSCDTHNLSVRTTPLSPLHPNPPHPGPPHPRASAPQAGMACYYNVGGNDDEGGSAA